MPLISRQSIEDLKARINIYDVVSPVVTLKRNGKNWVGLSPFSHEKTPSFYVLPDKGIYKCFSSGLAGDIFSFLEEQEKLTFHEAVEALAERFHIELQYEQGQGPDPQLRSLRQELLAIHDYAADFFHRAFLAEHEHSQQVRTYWQEKRGFTLDLAKEFKIGFAPPQGTKLNELLVQKGFSDDALRQCGLFYARDHVSDPRRWLNRFRGRLMVPIRNYQGQVIAFTARQLDLTPEDDPAREAKYINSPETPLFHKSQLVFNLERAREHVEDAGAFTIVEGQLDALRCWTSGIKAAIAPQGTSITEDQMRLLRRYSERVEVVLDGDNAGRKGALRMLPLAFKAGLEVRFIPLPDKTDPDDLLRNGGREAWEDCRKQAVEAIPFAARASLPRLDASPQERTNALQQLFAIIAECEQQALQNAYLEQAAECLHLDLAAAKIDFQRFQAARNRGQPTPVTATPALLTDKTANGKLTSIEKDLLWLILRDSRLAALVAPILDYDWIDRSTLEGQLLERFLAAAREGIWEDSQQSDALLETKEERHCFYNCLAEERDVEEHDLIAWAKHACLRAVHRGLKGQLEHLTRQVQNLPPQETDTLRKLLAQRKELLQLRADPSRLLPAELSA
ncbi:MAG: DNA primase [Verrucomicrobiota bacterium JB022]|nr:DNA primase [Verrucomicrobiota bacterium JB022]